MTVEWEGMAGQTAAQKAGLRYEKKVLKHLASLFPAELYFSPQLRFVDDTGTRYCVPDALLICEDRRVVIEIKAQHMPEAWWQLRKLYAPVVKELEKKAPVQVLEVCGQYDPLMPFPESVNIIYDLQKWIRGPFDPSFGVFVWKP